MECKKNPALAPVILFPKWEDKILISTSFFKLKQCPKFTAYQVVQVFSMSRGLRWKNIIFCYFSSSNILSSNLYLSTYNI